MTQSANPILRLSPRYVFRWEDSQAAYILLYPEGLIKLNGSAGEILRRCDGQRSVADIVGELQAAFPGNAEEISRGTQAFIDLAQDKGWLHV